MPKTIIISATPEETRMALAEDGKLMEYVVERNSEQHMVGSVFKGKVKNVVRGIQAAFVDIGREQNAFLFLGENSDVTEGQSVLVQVTKDARGTKGPTVVREIALPGRYAVLLPASDYIGISHKISNKDEKQRLKSLVAAHKPEGLGFVIRTLAEGVPDELLLADIRQLLATWQVISARAQHGQAPLHLYRELDLSVRIVRDYLTEQVDKIILDDAVVYKRVCELLSDMGSVLPTKLVLHESKDDVFAYYQLNDQIAGISDRKVWLDCGGYLVIDYTEAMTVIDVNSGKFSGNMNLEDTVMQINRQAAAEIARQLRLRDIGGIIVVDFIDMHSEENQKEIIALLNSVLADDKMKPKVQDITVLNLVEITRKKARQNLSTVLYNTCPTCQGSGRVQSPETISVEIRRRLRQLMSKRMAAKNVLIQVHPLVAEWLIKHDVKHMEREFSCSILVEADERLHVEAFAILDNTALDK